MPAIIFVQVSADCFHLHILARTSPQEVMNSQPTALTALKCFSFEVRVLKTVKNAEKCGNLDSENSI